MESKLADKRDFHRRRPSCYKARVELRAGDRIDRYTLVRPLGKGGQASVWQVVDPLDEGSLRALKLVQLADAGQAAFSRARREAKILAHLTHPSLCACHGFFEELDRGLVGVVLDLVQGRPLDDLQGDGRLDKSHRTAILMQVAEVLAHVHAAGLAHRDLKPSNILVTDAFWEKPHAPGTVKLVDFGIAVPIGNPQGLTSVGGVIGTVPYLSPELFDAQQRPASEESCARDLFAFGVIAWELLFGRHPTGLGHSASFEVMAQRYREFRDGKRPWPPVQVAGAWGTAIMSCLALRPEDRPEHGAALLEILRTGKLPVKPIASRTETHEAALAPPNLPLASIKSIPTTEPMTAPMPRVPPPPARTKEHSASKSIHGPVYALSFAIVVLAAAIYLRESQPAQPATTPASTTTTTSVVQPPPPTTLQISSTKAPEPTPAPVSRNGDCCGGIECKEPQKKVKPSKCELDGTQCTQCSSGRTYVPDTCAKELHPNREFLLRLAHVGQAPQGSMVCFRRANDPNGPQACLPMAEGSDVTKRTEGPAYDNRLRITTKDLVSSNIWVSVTHNRIPVAQGNTSYLGTLKVSALCLGTPVSIGESNTRIAFYLDDP